MAGPFAGVRVIEICEGMGPPLGAMLLGDLGAEVVKVEPPQGDRFRGTPAFHVLNRSKRGVVADLATAGGQAKVQPLLRAADIAIIGGGPASHRTCGLDAANLLRENPRLIVILAPMYGMHGPYADLPEEEGLLGALAGAYAYQASRSGKAIYQTIHVGVAGHGVSVAQAAAAGLINRERTGRGDIFEVSGLASWYQYATGWFLFPSIDLPRPRFRTGSGSANYGFYETADHAWFFIGAPSPRDFIKMVNAFGIEDVLSDPKYANGAPTADPDEMQRLRERCQKIIRSQPAAYWEQRLLENDCAYGFLHPREEYIEEEQVLVMEMVQEVEDPELGPTKQMGIPLNAYGTPGAIQGPAPRLDPTAPPPTWEQRDALAPTGTESSSPLPLEGYVLLDVATWVAGSFGPTLLSDLGIDVIKIESLDGDPARGSGIAYIGWNRGKRSLALDLRSERGRKALDRIVARADMVLTNLRPDPARRLGITWEAIRQVNPDAIFVSATTNGPIGPLKDRAGYDQVLEGRSGMSYQQAGGKGGEPVILGAPIDHTTGATNGLACLAGLYHQLRTGESQELHTSLLQGAFTVAANEFIFYPDKPSPYITKEEPQGTSALRQAYLCSDGKWIFLAVMAVPNGWDALTEGLGEPDWRIRWTTAQAQAEPVDGSLATQLIAVFETKPRDTWVEQLQRTGVPCVPCLHEQEVFDHPHPRANDLMLTATYNSWNGVDLGETRQVGRYIHFNHPVPPGRPAARLGEHSAEVLRQFGFSDAEIEELIHERAVVALGAAGV